MAKNEVHDIGETTMDFITGAGRERQLEPAKTVIAPKPVEVVADEPMIVGGPGVVVANATGGPANGVEVKRGK